jgi:hypothetical protein
MLRPILMGSLLTASLGARAANEDAEDWKFLGHVLSLVQVVARAAAQSADPETLQKRMDGLLSGADAQANRAVKGLMETMTEDLPAHYRGLVTSIGRDVATIARREAAKAPVLGTPVPLAKMDDLVARSRTDDSLQARKDLNAMGLRYFDEAQFLDAVRRNDALAVELFVLGRGVNLAARDPHGMTAREIAASARNDRMLEILARAR